MIESLRGLGYSTSTALADIIDNSISANACEVDIRFEWNDGDGYIHVLDNGDGMDDPALEDAMQLGAKNPLEERSAHDLGRFGLGLKTASFSQARRLTVSSKARGGNETACLRWDLDLLAAPGDEGWHLFEGPDPLSVSRMSPLSDHDHGTLVLWERLDRIITSGFTVQDFLDLQDEVGTSPSNDIPSASRRREWRSGHQNQWETDRTLGPVHGRTSEQGLGIS